MYSHIPIQHTYKCLDLKHPSIHFLYPLNPLVGSLGGWSLSQLSSGERRGIPWTGRQSITGPHRDKRDKQPHTLLRTILESSINLTCMFLDGGRKPEYPERTRGAHAKPIQKGPRWGSNLEPCHCEATVLTTTPPTTMRDFTPPLSQTTSDQFRIPNKPNLPVL